MEKTLLSLSGALALATLAPTVSSAQFTVWKDGVSVYALEEGSADYVTFDYSPIESLAEDVPAPSVGGNKSAAQFTVWKDGISVYALEDGRADYVTFDYAPVGSLAEANPDPSVGGAVPDESAAVDLGLTSGTLWAPWNVGATKPGEAGAYLAWGETTAKENYDWESYKWMKEGESDETHITKYTIKDGQTTADWYTEVKFVGDGKTSLDEDDDAAAVNWGGGWRTPTQAQFKELSDYCTREWKDANWDANGSLAGYLLTSKTNGKTLFLPAAGRRLSRVHFLGERGNYWYAELNSGKSSQANNLFFGSDFWSATTDDYRHTGFPVRPVFPSAEATKVYNTPDSSVGGQVPTAAEAVDLGLPSGTLWAPYNVGATKAGETGAYFAWGETTAKENYAWESYKWMKEGESDETHITKYTIKDGQTTADWYTEVKFVGDGKTSLETADDAAAQNWGGKWRMPTQAQIKELFDECTAEWEEADWDANGSLAGYLLTSKANGKTLFLPAAGRHDTSLDYVGKGGYYWSAELDSNSSYACDLFFMSGYWSATSKGYRYSGFSVRPVCPSAE
ncbi:MAG: hypothetical protein ACI35Q_04745 [Marinilabiliaceae bacterium]